MYKLQRGNTRMASQLKGINNINTFNLKPKSPTMEANNTIFHTDRVKHMLDVLGVNQEDVKIKFSLSYYYSLIDEVRRILTEKGYKIEHLEGTSLYGTSLYGICILDTKLLNYLYFGCKWYENSMEDCYITLELFKNKVRYSKAFNTIILNHNLNGQNNKKIYNLRMIAEGREGTWSDNVDIDDDAFDFIYFDNEMVADFDTNKIVDTIILFNEMGLNAYSLD